MFPRLSLRYRIALVIFLLEACMLTVVLSVTLSQSRQTAGDFDAASQEASLDLLANLSVPALLTGEYSDYQIYLQDVEKQPTIDRIVLADLQNHIVASSRVEDVGQDLRTVANLDGPGWRTRAIDTAAGKLGTLAVAFSDQPLVTAYGRTRNLALVVAGVGMTIIALVGLATGFALTRRLERVANAARRFAEGHTDARTGLTGRDEVALLARNFDHMAAAVAEQQRQLREQGEYIGLLLNSTAEAIYGVDTSGVCTFANPACLRMLGYRHESELVGRNIHALIHHTFPDGRPYPKEECRVRRSTLQGETSHADDEVHWRADGSSFPVEYWSHPIFRDGQLIGAVVTFVDITARKQAEAEVRRYRDELEQRVEARTVELRAANRELEAFSYSISHDLRAPLRAIDGFSRIVLEDHAAQLDAEARDHLVRVRSAVQRMGTLIDDLIELSRVGRMEMQRMDVDLSDIAREVLDQLRASEPGRLVELAIAPGLHGRGDERLVRLLLQNLFDNAWKYTRRTAQARIEFSADPGTPGGYIVRDNGAGFDMQYAHKLFQPFQRLHRAEDFEGAGVGLATVARIVHRHGGQVWVEAEVGKGTTFHFTLGAVGQVVGDR